MDEAVRKVPMKTGSNLNNYLVPMLQTDQRKDLNAGEVGEWELG